MTRTNPPIGAAPNLSSAYVEGVTPTYSETDPEKYDPEEAAHSAAMKSFSSGDGGNISDRSMTPPSGKNPDWDWSKFASNPKEYAKQQAVSAIGNGLKSLFSSSPVSNPADNSAMNAAKQGIVPNEASPLNASLIDEDEALTPTVASTSLAEYGF